MKYRKLNTVKLCLMEKQQYVKRSKGNKEIGRSQHGCGNQSDGNDCIGWGWKASSPRDRKRHVGNSCAFHGHWEATGFDLGHGTIKFIFSGVKVETCQWQQAGRQVERTGVGGRKAKRLIPWCWVSCTSRMTWKFSICNAATFFSYLSSQCSTKLKCTPGICS